MARPGCDIPALTSLRILAAVGVFVSHLPYTDRSPILSPFTSLFAEGFVGVPFFFILSGFVLTINYHDRFARLFTRESRSYLVARFARIYPLHWLTMLFAVIWLWSATPPMETTLGEAGRLVANLALVQSFTHDPNVAAVFNSVSWTLCCEIVFYVMLPMLLWAITRFGNRIGMRGWLTLAIMGAILPLVFAQVMKINSKSIPGLMWLFLPPIINLPLFLVGMCMGLAHVRKDHPAIVSMTRRGTGTEIAVLIWLAIAIGLAVTVVPIWYRKLGWYVPVMSALVWVMAQQRGTFSRWASHPWAVYLGEISFGFYMIHGLMLNVIFGTIAPMWSSVDVAVWAVIGLVLTTGLAGASFRWFESPARRMITKRFGGGQRQGAVAVVSERRAA